MHNENVELAEVFTFYIVHFSFIQAAFFSLL